MRVLLTLLKVVAVSAPLTWVWMEWGRDVYGELFLRMALPIYGLFGLTDLMPEGARDRFINYLPFLILMLITPRMTWRRRVGGTAIGFAVIFCAHLVFVYAAGEASRQMTVRQFMRIVPANVLSDAMPFVLWVAIARDWVWETVGRVLGQDATRSSPGSSPGPPEPADPGK